MTVSRWIWYEACVHEGNLMGNGATSAEVDYRYTPANYVDVMTFHIKDAKIDRIRINTLLD